MRQVFRLVLAALAALTFAGCSNIDCPLDNVVLAQAGLYSYETKQALKLTDSLTVTLPQTGMAVLHRATGIQSFLFPLKEGAGCDTLLCRFSNSAGQQATDTLFLTHTPSPHFESLDCPPAVFHTLTSVRATSHSLGQMPLTIDSVSVVRSSVNYDDIENIRIFLRATASH